MDAVINSLNYVVFVIKLISVIVLLVGLFWYLKDLIIGIIKKKGDTTTRILAIKNKLGAVVLLGLEILIIADIIETIIEPTLSDVALLAAIVIIRTIISYFLNKEVSQTGAEKKKDKEKKEESTEVKK